MELSEVIVMYRSSRYTCEWDTRLSIKSQLSNQEASIALIYSNSPVIVGGAFPWKER